MNIYKPHNGVFFKWNIKSNLPIRSFGILLMFLCTSLMLFAQKVNVSGQELNENRNPIAGATVQLKGAQSTSITDVSGNFSISVTEKKGVLVISYVGYSNKEVAVGNGPIMVQLQPLNNSLGE